MVDLDILKKKGVSVETLREIFKLTKQKQRGGAFTAVFEKGSNTQKAKIAKLTKRICNRIRGGRDYNLTNYRIYQALDAAWDLPLKQITPTMLRQLLDKQQEPTAVIDTLKSWGIDPAEVLIEVPDPKDPTQTQKAVSLPAFARVYVPLAKSYVTIRGAKLVNDRNQVPHFKYEPAISNKETRMRCEIITAAVEDISNNYSSFDTEKQAILKMLHYGEQIIFPQESWHFESQLAENESGYKGTKKGDFVETVTREGIRFHQPHPARTYRDMAHPGWTLNTGTGAKYSGYWRIMRYGELMENDQFWNLDVIRIGNSDWYTSGAGLFNNVYPCTMSFPSMTMDGGGVSEKDSEKHVGDGFYANDLEDKGILVNEYFEKLNPKENGLGDYDYDVWFRFVVASDDTIVFAEPLPYTAPTPYYGYDAMDNRTIQSSMTLEILPHQDHITNLFTQYLLSTKNNLGRVTMADTDVLPQSEINRLRGFSNLTQVGNVIVPFSGKEFKTRDTSPRALYVESVAQVDTQAIAMAMRLVLEMVERLLVMSPQEMGQPASHEQTREEVKVIGLNSSARAEYTGAAADRARESIKRILYEGLMAYGEDEFYAQIPADPEINKQMLEDLGFTWAGEDKDNGRLTVKATKKAVRKTAIGYMKFVANRDGEDRINEVEEARKMAVALAEWMNNPIIGPAIGPDQAIQMVNFIARAAGFPRDFRIVNKLNDATMLQQNTQQIMTQVQDALKQVVAQINTEMKGALKEVMTENGDQQKQIDELKQAIMQVIQPSPAPPQIAQMPPPMAGAA